jgi:CxxC motif-containing protein/thioredoxin reductase
MINSDMFDVAVIGGGPAGLASAISAVQTGARVVIVEREPRLGGILKQCVHGGFGSLEFKDQLTGPEYIERFIEDLLPTKVSVYENTFVLQAGKDQKTQGFDLTLQNSQYGIFEIHTRTIVLATGCRERTSKQVFIHGSRPSGIFTAGTAQHLVNLNGLLPCTKCVILGSGDVGLIMARRLTLEGAKVLGVYEIKPEPTGLPRNIAQCLNDYGIPLYLSHTVTRVFGDERLEAVEISKVDENMRVIPGTGQILECDGLITSVGLIPENEIAEQLGVEISPVTKGPVVDQDLMTNVPGIFACGNNLAIFDLVDYATETGRIAGKAAAEFAQTSKSYSNKVYDYVSLKLSDEFLYCVPQRLKTGYSKHPVRIYFRPTKTIHDVQVTAKVGNYIVGKKYFPVVRPQQIDTLTFEASAAEVLLGDVTLEMRDLGHRRAENTKSEREAEGRIICVVCPKGCEISYAHNETREPEVWGYGCDRGREFALKEIVEPSRMVFSTVITSFAYMPLLPVKTDRSVPLDKVFDVMNVIKSLKVSRPVKRGEVLVGKIAGTSANLVATSDMFLVQKEVSRDE